MARLCLLLLTTSCLLVDTCCSLGAGDTEGDAAPSSAGQDVPPPDSVFATRQSALAILGRRRRHNSGHFEELQRDNLERECLEERCTFEEAREVFENDEKTLEFWAGYVDGNQCDPPPCQNGGQCKDGVNDYVCYCNPNFSGKNCEIEVFKQCEDNNGGCAHICVIKERRAVCQCASGYRLGADKSSCEPTEQFPCGLLSTVLFPRTRPPLRAHGRGVRLRPRSFNVTLNATMEDEVDMIYDWDYDFYRNDSDDDSNALNFTSSADGDVLSTDFTTSVPTEVVNNGSGRLVRRRRRVYDTSAFYGGGTVPNITAVVNPWTKVVGGKEAVPGQIPWQVTLMTLPSKLPFCGGSLLSEVWVITAAHCLEEIKAANQSFIVRAGEHDLTRVEGNEKDHAVAELHLHPKYDARKSRYNHDIALLKLASPVELSDHRLPICLGPTDFTETIMRNAEQGSLVSGWGRLKFQGPEAPKLQVLAVPYVDRTECKGSSRDHITRFMFCAGYKNLQMDACQGDSGGPHSTNFQGTWFLTGIVSWGEECAKEGKYGIYTRVSRYYPWISHTTGLQVSNSL